MKGIIITITIIILFSGILKSQVKPIELIDSINNDYIFKNLMGIQMQGYYIKKNHHSPQNRRFILQSSREFAIVCMFGKTCLYSFADRTAQQAVNKIFGYSFGPNHHSNSFRIGWRCRDSIFEILAYWYIKRVRCHKLLFSIEPGKRFSINSIIGDEKARVNYLIEGKHPVCEEVVFNPEKRKLKRWGYVNYPYFGGRKKAPHDMEIFLKTWMHR